MRKSFVKTTLALTLIASMLIIPCYADSAKITGDYVNFRSGPGLSYGIIGCLRSGTEVTVTGTEGSWSAVSYGGDIGYISSQYLLKSSSVTVTSGSQSQIASSSSAVLVSSDADSIVLIDSSEDSKTYGSSFDDTDDNISESTAAEATPAPSSTPAPTAAPASAATPVPTAAVEVSDSNSSSSAAGYISGDYVRFRTGPSTSYTIISTYNKGKTLSILGTSNDWTKCEIDGKTGFVFSQYVKQDASASSVSSTVKNTVETVSTPVPSAAADTSSASQSSSVSDSSSGITKAGYISGNNVRFRAAASLDADIIGEFFFANSVTITGTSGDWTAVSADGKTGYVYSKYVKEGTYSNSSSSGETSTASGQAVVDYAMTLLGSPYKWGGTDPSGFDCSGFVYYVYQHFGITLNRVAQDQASNGSHVDPSSLQAGDILCFYSGSNYIGHSGIYIGGGKFIHSATSSTGVIITDLSGYYTTRGYEARRVLQS